MTRGHAISLMCRKCRAAAVPDIPWRRAVTDCTHAECPLHHFRPQSLVPYDKPERHPP